MITGLCVCMYILMHTLCLPRLMGWCSLGQGCGIYRCRWDLQLSLGNLVPATRPTLGVCVCVCTCVCVGAQVGCSLSEAVLSDLGSRA